MTLASTLASAATSSVKKAFLILHNTADVQTVNNKTAIAQAEAALNAARLHMAPAASSMYVLEVQYNPSTLGIYGSANQIFMSSLQQGIDTGVIAQLATPPSIRLSVDLIFDAMNIPDSFLLEKLSPSLGNAVSNISAIHRAAKGQHYTVQPQTNGLLALLMRPQTRFVTFRWGDMSFSGTVCEAQAEYTMFSVSGRPVRSKIRLNILQQVESKGDTQYWDEAYEKFGEQMSGLGKGAAQNVGSMFNLNAF